jgi:hypothetical protein
MWGAVPPNESDFTSAARHRRDDEGHAAPGACVPIARGIGFTGVVPRGSLLLRAVAIRDVQELFTSPPA